jgi:hypothetical protein
MGTSFTEFGGYGFWTRDSALEVWLSLLAREVDQSVGAPDWLRDAGGHWQEVASIGMIGCISAQLDERLTDPERTRVVVDLAERTLAWLRAQGQVLSAALLDSLGTGGEEAYFTRDVDTDVFVRIGETFIRLLQGELRTDARTSPVV